MLRGGTGKKEKQRIIRKRDFGLGAHLKLGTAGSISRLCHVFAVGPEVKHLIPAVQSPSVKKYLGKGYDMRFICRVS